MIVDENGMCTLSEEDCSYHSHTAKRTNADKIRSMSDEELAELFANDWCGYCKIYNFCVANGNDVDCKGTWLDWLKGEAKE